MKRLHAGFSLIELSVVVTIVAVVLVAGLDLVGGQDKLSKIEDSRERLTVVQEALTRYMQRNSGNLPCPAPLDAPISDTRFGVPEDCTTSALATTGRKTLRLASADGPQVRSGAVPVQELGLASKYAFDSYGSRIVYVVTEDVVTGASIEPGIRVFNDAGVELAERKPFLLMSHGPDAKGAFNYDGKQAKACGGGRKDAENCGFSNADFTIGRFNDGDLADSKFDDLIVAGPSDVTFPTCLDDEKMVFVGDEFTCQKILPVCSNGDVIVQQGSGFVCQSILDLVNSVLPVCNDEEVLAYNATAGEWTCGDVVVEVAEGGSSCSVTAPSGNVFSINSGESLSIPCNDYQLGTCAVSNASVRFACANGTPIQVSANCSCGSATCGGYGSNPNYCDAAGKTYVGKLTTGACSARCLEDGATRCLRHTNSDCYVCNGPSARKIGGCSGCRLSSCTPTINDFNAGVQN